MSEWFDVYSLTDPSQRENLQIEGSRESVGFLRGLIEEEAKLLGGESMDGGGVVVVEISQGCAVGLLTFLSGRCKLGAFVGSSGWMALKACVESFIGEETMSEAGLAGFLRAKLDLEGVVPSIVAQSAALETPVFVSHAEDDDAVDIELGRQMRAVLEKLEMRVTWKEYGDGGHWVKEPEGFDDIVEFLPA